MKLKAANALTRPAFAISTNPAGYSLTYNGLVMALEKRPSNGWQAFGSYTAIDGLRAAAVQRGNRSRRASQYGFPSAAIDVRARSQRSDQRTRPLPNDRPHAIRAMGRVDIPRTGFVVAANLQYFSGKPWAATALVALPQTGDQPTQRVLLEPRGTQRLSSQTLLDLRVSRTITLGGAGRIELMVDVLNALNDTAEEALATDNLFSANFRQPTLFMDPRRAMIGIRLNLGR